MRRRKVFFCLLIISLSALVAESYKQYDSQTELEASDSADLEGWDEDSREGLHYQSDTASFESAEFESHLEIAETGGEMQARNADSIDAMPVHADDKKTEESGRNKNPDVTSKKRKGNRKKPGDKTEKLNAAKKGDPSSKRPEKRRMKQPEAAQTDSRTTLVEETKKEIHQDQNLAEEKAPPTVRAEDFQELKMTLPSPSETRDNPILLDKKPQAGTTGNTSSAIQSTRTRDDVEKEAQAMAEVQARMSVDDQDAERSMNETPENPPIPLPSPSKSNPSEVKSRYLIRLKDSAFKNFSNPSARASEKNTIVTAVAQELDTFLTSAARYLAADGRLYLFQSEFETFQKTEFMFYELIKDPETYYNYSAFYVEEITDLKGGVSKTIDALLAEDPQNSTTARWYIKELFKRAFEKRKDTDEGDAKGDPDKSIASAMANHLIMELSELIKETRKSVSTLPTLQIESKDEIAQILDSVGQIETLLSTLDSNVTSGIREVVEKIQENWRELRQFTSSVAELKSHSDENKRTLNSLISSVNSLTGISKPLYHKLEEVCEKKSTCREETLQSIDRIIRDIKQAVTRMESKNLTYEDQSLRNYTGSALITLGTFIKDEIEQVKNESRAAYDLIQKRIQASTNTNGGITNTLKVMMEQTNQELFRRMSSTNEQLANLAKSVSTMNTNLTEFEQRVKQGADEKGVSTLQKDLSYVMNVVNKVFVQLDDVSKLLKDQIESVKNQTIFSTEELKITMQDVVHIQGSAELQEKEKAVILDTIKKAIESSADRWQARFGEILEEVSSASQASAAAILEVRKHYENQTKSLINGFQYCTVAGAMQHQILREMNKTLIGIDDRIGGYMSKFPFAMQEAGAAFLKTMEQNPQPKSGDECAIEATASKIMESLDYIVDSKLKSRRHYRLAGRTMSSNYSSNSSKLDDDDIRYNFEDLVWVLKACHTGDPALCGYAWCAKVCGFDCPFNCKRYVECFKKYNGHKSMVRDCYVGLDDLPVKIPPGELTLNLQCTSSLLSGREVGRYLAAFETPGGNFFRKQVTTCNISGADASTSNVTAIKGYTVLVSSCIKCRQHLEDWDGANVTRLINYVEANCTDYPDCNGMTADPTKICCPEYPCPGNKDKEACCDKPCLHYYKSGNHCYKPKILVSSPFVKNHDLTAGSRTILGSLFVGKTIEIVVTFPDRCTVPGFQMIVAGMTQLPKGKHPGSKSNNEEEPIS